jgi:hypothetical protein
VIVFVYDIRQLVNLDVLLFVNNKARLMQQNIVVKYLHVIVDAFLAWLFEHFLAYYGFRKILGSVRESIEYNNM